MSFDIVVAMDNQKGIGRNGALPWSLKKDMSFFRDLTTTSNIPKMQNLVIMGRKTWDSLPERFRPLPNRINVFLTRETPNCIMALSSFEDALRLRGVADRCFVIGGASVYAEALCHPDLKRVYVTEVDGDFNCDTFFPKMPEQFAYSYIGDWQIENGMQFRFTTWESVSSN